MNRKLGGHRQNGFNTFMAGLGTLEDGLREKTFTNIMCKTSEFGSKNSKACGPVCVLDATASIPTKKAAKCCQVYQR
jgi:hypothetical protein